MKNITKIAIVILLSLSNANEANHNINIGLDSLSGDVKADYGINLGYSYVLGDKWKYGIGTNIIIANGHKEIGDTFSIDVRLGKEVFKDITLYGLVGVSGMNTGYKDSSDNDEIAAGITYGIIGNYSLSEKCALQVAYKTYKLEYKLNGIENDFDVNSVSLNYIYKF